MSRLTDDAGPQIKVYRRSVGQDAEEHSPRRTRSQQKLAGSVSLRGRGATSLAVQSGPLAREALVAGRPPPVAAVLNLLVQDVPSARQYAKLQLGEPTQ